MPPKKVAEALIAANLPMAIGESFAAHETVNRSSREYVRDTVRVNLVEGCNARVRRTIAGVFHHISPELADLDARALG